MGPVVLFHGRGAWGTGRMGRLRFLRHPLVQLGFLYETAKRLSALKRYVEGAESSVSYFFTGSSRSTLPSRRNTIRCACIAMSCSCVTRMIVFPA